MEIPKDELELNCFN